MSKYDRLPKPNSESYPLSRGVQRATGSQAAYEYSIPAQSPALGYYLKVLFKHRWTIILYTLLVTGAIWLLLRHVQPLYEASATIQIDPEKVEVLNKPMVYQNWLDPEYFNTQLKLLASPVLAKQAILALGLDKNPDFLSSRPTTLTGALAELVLPGTSTTKITEREENPESIPEADTIRKDEPDPLESHISEILSGLQIVPIPKTRLVRINYRHHDRKVAQKIANTLAETFIRNNLERRTNTSRATSVFLQQTLAALQTEIQVAEEQLIEYGKTHEIVSLDADQNTVVERLLTLNRQLLEAEEARKEAESIYRISQSGTSVDSMPEVISSQSIRGLRERLSILKQKRAEMLVTYNDVWPEMEQIEKIIAELEQELGQETKRILSGIETRYRAAIVRERLLRTDFDKQMGTTLKQSESAINYNIKLQEIDSRKELQKTILAHLKEADMAASSDMNNMSLAAAPVLPRKPVSPRIPLTLSIALCCSLLGAVCFAFIREYLGTRIDCVEDVDRFVNLPTLGLIPEFKAELTNRPMIELISGEPASRSENMAPEVAEKSTKAITASAFNVPDSAVAEAYRHLRTSMILDPSLQNNKVVLVTSGQPGEGKTTTAINIAIALAHTGAKVLLIDADLRRGHLHNYLNLETNAGLAQYLSGHLQMEELFHNTSVTNLCVIAACGTLPLYPAELLGSPRMKVLMKYVSATRDYVIIDSPPILPFTDAAILSAEVDGVLLVVNSEKSHRELVKRSYRMLNDVGANLIGVVLNHVDHEKTNYRGYYKYSDGSNHSVLQRVLATLRK